MSKQKGNPKKTLTREVDVVFMFYQTISILEDTLI